MMVDATTSEGLCVQVLEEHEVNTTAPCIVPGKSDGITTGKKEGYFVISLKEGYDPAQDEKLFFSFKPSYYSVIFSMDLSAVVTVVYGGASYIILFIAVVITGVMIKVGHSMRDKVKASLSLQHDHSLHPL